MATRLPFELLENPEELARFEGWSQEVYRDLLAVQREEMSVGAFDARYLTRRAILVLDLTGFTENAMRGGSLQAFLRILDAQKLCLPILRARNADFIRTFADDVVALFVEPDAALDAALEIHRWVGAEDGPFAHRPHRAECCIGLGFGPVYAIGPNRAMGDEMNRTSKLGEDTARGGETLVTERVQLALQGRQDVSFERQEKDDLLFPYFRVERREPGTTG